jgi:hypothetical protein
MRHGIVAGILSGFTLLAAGCSNVSSPVAPPSPTVVGVTPPPPLSRPGRLYVAAPSQQPMSWYTRSSSYILYDDGRFSLEYPHVAYSGSYRVAGNGVVTFEWDGSSTAGPWESTGTLTEESLTVRYGTIMIHIDFEDAAYVRVRP